MPVWRGEGDFLSRLMADPTSGGADGNELEALFDLGYHFKYVDTIFARVFGEGEAAVSPRTIRAPAGQRGRFA